ncbi:MAG: hypothetical protein ACLUTA_14075 [Blautia wexlerae]
MQCEGAYRRGRLPIPKYGARPLRRAIQSKIEDAMAR